MGQQGKGKFTGPHKFDSSIICNALCIKQCSNHSQMVRSWAVSLLSFYFCAFFITEVITYVKYHSEVTISIIINFPYNKSLLSYSRTFSKYLSGSL